MTTNESLLVGRATKKAAGEPLRVAWHTPLGVMRGLVGHEGLRELHFPAGGEQTINAPDIDAVDVAEVAGGEAGAKLEAAARTVEEVTAFLQKFFAGQPVGRLPRLDLSGVSAFDRAVWEATVKIPWGATKSYGQIAAEIGRPGAARAVGGALGRNRLVLLVPCHRVISSAGGARALCGFTGGLDLKRYLLALEGAWFGAQAQAEAAAAR